jgi:cyclopropane fatty-acyl-phospholipid synthase-like methyltransferase
MASMYNSHADLYDLIYTFKDYPAEAEAIRALLQSRGVSDGSRLLEVACGTGSYLAAFARWYDVAGCDLSAEMITIARRKLDAAGRPDAPVWATDMRDLMVDAPYDVVLCLFSSIGYLPDEESVRAAIVRMAAAVRPGGLVGIEPWIDRERYQAGRPHLQTYTSPDLYLARGNVSEIDGDYAVFDMHWLVVPRGGPVTTFVDQHRLWFCPPGVIERAMRDAGLTPTWLQDGIGRGLWIGVRG